MKAVDFTILDSLGNGLTEMTWDIFLKKKSVWNPYLLANPEILYLVANFLFLEIAEKHEV